MRIPYTLDLTERARLAIRHMAANRDSRTGYPYFYINVSADPPHAAHDAWDVVDQLSRYVDSLILAREMTGETHRSGAEETYRRLLLDSLSPDDGLAYRPQTPWSAHEAGMFDQSRALNALVTWTMKEDDATIRRYADRLVDGLWNTAVHVVRERPGYAFCYHPYASRFPDGWNPVYPAEPCCYGGGSLILPLVKYAEVSGSERALEMARRLVHFIVDESGVFRADGSFWPDQMLPEHGHFHTRSLTMAGVLRFALLTGDEALIAWVKRAFDWAMTSSGSFGWFPEGVGTTEALTTRHSETCNITDMLHVALKLAGVFPGYWAHAERIIRNHLLESQWTREDWLAQPKGELPEDDAVFTHRDMAERIMGGFAGRTRPNEFVTDGVMMGCCCGAGPRALYLAWEHTLVRHPEGLYVNLHLNRFSLEADVLSHLPHEGRLDINLRSEGPLFVRVPEAGERDMSVHRNHAPAGYVRSGEYVRLDASPGDAVSIRFPLARTERTERLLDWDLRERWRGETLVSLSPEGRRFPLYQRQYLDSDAVPFRDIDAPERRDPSFRW